MARIIGWDPGIINCAWAVYDTHINKLYATGVEEGIGKDLTRINYFAGRIERVLKYYAPNLCCVERYQLRRGRGFIGNMEKVNIMIGTIVGLCSKMGIKPTLVTPAVHKTYAKNNWGATKGKNGKISTRSTKLWQHLPTEHEADAANIAKYAKKFITTEK